MTEERWRGISLITASSFCFALSAILARIAAVDVPSPQLVLIRFLVGLVACVGAFLVLRRWPNLSAWRLLLARGGMGAVTVLLYFFAIAKVGAAVATVLFYCSPIYAALFARLFLKERPSRWMAVGLLLTTVGAALVSFKPSAEVTDTWRWGATAGVLAGVLGGASLTVTKAARGVADTWTVFFAFSVIASFVAAPLAVPGWVPVFGTPLAATVLGMALASLLAQLLLTHGLGLVSATLGSALTQLVPVLAWALALTVMQEQVTTAAILGALLCMSGIGVTLAGR